MTIEGLCEAVSIPEGSDTFQNDDVMDENEILQWCSSLVRRSPDGQYLEFAHYSVEEFLRDVCPGDPVFDSYSISTEKARSLVGQLSLRYLTFRDHELDFGPTETEMHATLAKNAKRPFYEFATLWWVDCIREQPAREFVLESVQSLFNPKKSASFHAWALELLRPCFMKLHKDYRHDLLRAGSGLLRPDFTTLHMASGLGLLSICEELVREGPSMINRGSAYGTPLHCAIGGLDICADGTGRVLNHVSHIVHAPEGSRAAPDRQNIVRTLLDAGAQVTVRLATRHRVLSPLSLSAILASSEMGSRRGFLAQQLRMITELLSTGFQVEEQDLVHFSNFLIRPNVATDDSESISALQKLSDTLAHSHQNVSTSRLQHLLQIFESDYGIPLRTGPSQIDGGKSDMDGFIAAIRNNDSINLERLLEGEGAAMLKEFRLTAPGIDAERWTPVHVAIDAGAMNTLEVLLKYGFDPDEMDSKGNTPLHLCSRLHCESGARILIHHGASSLKRNNRGETAWYEAASKGATMVLQVLLVLAADNQTEALQMESESGNTPICKAIKELNKESVLLLLPYCSSKQFWKGEKRICFRKAAMMGSTKVIKSLLDAGFGPDDWDSELGSPLHHLPFDCTVQHVRLLKASFPHSPRRSTDGKSAFELHLAHSLKTNREADEEVLAELLPEDASELNHLARAQGLKMLEGDLAALMHHAACLGRTTIVRFLHRNGADINAKTRNGYSPLHLAVQAENPEMVDTLLKLGADRDPVVGGLTPLALACKNANSEIVWKLLDQKTGPANTSESLGGGKPAVEIRESHPWVLDALGTELLDAIIRQDIEACEYLKNIGIPMDVQLAKASGLTPLMAAIRLPDCLDVAEWLLDNGASVSLDAPPWPSRSKRPTRFYTALEAAALRPSCNRILSRMTWKYFQEGGCFLGLPQSPIHAAVRNPQGLSIMLQTLQEILSDSPISTISTDCNPNILNANRTHVFL